MFSPGSHIAEQKILLVETYRTNFREFTDWPKDCHQARVARRKLLVLKICQNIYYWSIYLVWLLFELELS